MAKLADWNSVAKFVHLGLWWSVCICCLTIVIRLTLAAILSLIFGNLNIELINDDEKSLYS